DRVFYVLDRGEDRVDSDNAQGCIGYLVLFGVDITTAFAYGQFNLQVNGIFHVEDDQVRIQHGKVVRKLGDITGGQLVLTVDQDEYLFRVAHFAGFFEAHLLEVQNDLGNVFYYSLDR